MEAVGSPRIEFDAHDDTACRPLRYEYYHNSRRAYYYHYYHWYYYCDNNHNRLQPAYHTVVFVACLAVSVLSSTPPVKRLARVSSLRAFDGTGARTKNINYFRKQSRPVKGVASDSVAGNPRHIVILSHCIFPSISFTCLGRVSVFSRARGASRRSRIDYSTRYTSSLDVTKNYMLFYGRCENKIPIPRSSNCNNYDRFAVLNLITPIII